MAVFYADIEIIGAWINNAAVLEDMAEIDHIFCDKTGTLTKNELIFREMAIIGGIKSEVPSLPVLPTNAYKEGDENSRTANPLGQHMTKQTSVVQEVSDTEINRVTMETSRPDLIP